MTARALENDVRRAFALLAEMGGDVDAAIVELQALAHGIVPSLLVERGLASALTEAAQRAKLILRQDGDVLVFSVSDNGTGQGLSKPLAPGHGVINTQDRMLAIGGRLEIASNADGTGFRVVGSIPQIRTSPSKSAGTR